MRTVLLSVGGMVLFTLGVSWAMYRASNRSALWNMAAGAAAVILAAILLTLVVIYLTSLWTSGLN